MTSKETLLEKAKAVSHRSTSGWKYSAEHYELAIAFLRGEVTLSGVNHALGKKQTNNSYSNVVAILRDGIASEAITVELKTR